MKRLLLFALAVLLLSTYACKKDHDFDAEGAWMLNYKWTASRYTGSAVMRLFPSGTATFDGSTYTAIWGTSGDKFTMTFPNGTQYTGTANGGDFMSGTMMSDGDPGTWNANRLSDSP